MAARIRARDREFDARRMLNQELAKLVAFAFHDPGRMPDYTRQSETARAAPETDERAAGEQLRAGLIGMAVRARAADQRNRRR